MTQAEVEAKALELIGAVLGRDARRSSLMRNLEAVPDITALRRLWRPSKDLPRGAE
jgi:hypothetical protein